MFEGDEIAFFGLFEHLHRRDGLLSQCSVDPPLSKQQFALDNRQLGPLERGSLVSELWNLVPRLARLGKAGSRDRVR